MFGFSSQQDPQQRDLQLLPLASAGSTVLALVVGIVWGVRAEREDGGADKDQGREVGVGLRSGGGVGGVDLVWVSTALCRRYLAET